MAAAPVALLPEKDAKRVLILGGNFTDFASFSALLQSARILYIPDWNEISRGEARHFDPNVVVCSGEAFRALCSPPVALTTAAGPGLTARQREVLALVAKGLTNRKRLGDRAEGREPRNGNRTYFSWCDRGRFSSLSASGGTPAYRSRRLRLHLPLCAPIANGR